MKYHTTIMNGIMKLFFEDTLKHWSFTEIVKESKMSRERVNYYLGKLITEKMIIRVKPKLKMPYYIANRNISKFRTQKRLYGLEKLSSSGLFDYISSLSGIKCAILFGSFSRGDWNIKSDVDIFIYGDIDKINFKKFEGVLQREIQIFVYNKIININELDNNVINNISKGFYLLDKTSPFTVKINA